MDLTRFKVKNDQVEWVGVLIRRNPLPATNTHAAVAYRDMDGILMMHMADHELFLAGRCDPSYLCAVPPLDPVLAQSFADYCARVARANSSKKIPYDLIYEPRSLFDADGEWCPPTPDAGLNCSSFILGLFKSYKIDLIDFISWPLREEDSRAQIPLVEWLVASSNPSKKAQGIKIAKQIGKHPRVRPEETAGACLEDIPAGYQLCEAAGKRVAEICDQHLATPLASMPLS